MPITQAIAGRDSDSASVKVPVLYLGGRCPRHTNIIATKLDKYHPTGNASVERCPDLVAE